MSVLINFKICDNSPDCNSMAVCKTGALTWDKNNRTIKIDNDKCINCCLCEKACMVFAIKVAKTKEEYETSKREIEDDPRKVSDLFIDRYGAEPINEAFITLENDFEKEILKSNKTAVVEIFNNDSIQCLLKSIPIKELFKDKDVRYRKVCASGTFIDKYKISNLPSLLFFKDGSWVGKIEGYFEKEEKESLIKKINEILK